MNPPSEERGFAGYSSASTLALAVLVSQPGLAYALSSQSGFGVAASSIDERPKAQDLGAQLRDPELLAQIISEVPDMYELLRDAAAELDRAFEGRATIILEPFVDPESTDSPATVIVVAATTMSFEDADAILDSVLESWWEGNQHRADYRVSLATELL